MSVRSGWKVTLLIVPYGIETQLKSLLFFHQILLIVPYGIETGLWESYRSLRQCLLIVPYGIENNHNNNRKDIFPILTGIFNIILY